MKKKLFVLLAVVVCLFAACETFTKGVSLVNEVYSEMKLLGSEEVEAKIIAVSFQIRAAETKEEKEALRLQREMLGAEWAGIVTQAISNVASRHGVDEEKLKENVDIENPIEKEKGEIDGM